MTFVLDSWIILAWLKDRNPGADVMTALWEKANTGRARLLMNIINIGEVFYLTAKARDESAADTVLRNLKNRELEIVAAPDDLVLHAAVLKARHRISYADAFAAATAIRHGAPLVTGDAELKPVTADGLKLQWIGS